MEKLMISKLSVRIVSLIILLCMVLMSIQGIFGGIVFAESNFETSNVLEDLVSATIDGKKFNINDYPYNKSGNITLMQLVEYCYSYKENKNEDYGLFVYIYNPANVNLDEGSLQNKIQISFGGGNTYEKLALKFVNKSTGNYLNRFLKYKVLNANKYLSKLDRNERVYRISGIELLTKGNQNATEYKVGSTYVYNGFAKGYGYDDSLDSTLTCSIDSLETIILEVNHSTFRTNSSSVGAHHYNQVNTAYFSIPNRYFAKNGNLQKIRAHWWEYKTKPAFVTSNKTLYDNFLPNTKLDTEVNQVEGKMFNTVSRSTDANGSVTEFYDKVYNIKPSYSGTSWAYQRVNVSKSYDMIPFAFYSENATSDRGVFNIFNSKQKAGGVSKGEVADWIYNYSNNLNRGYIDCNGRKISKDLFETSIDSGRTYGFNDKTIDLGDTFDMLSYDSNHTWWDKLWDYGFSWPQSSPDYTNISPIYELKANDLVNINDEVSNNLLIDKNDLGELKSYFVKESALGNSVILFRFASTDYYCENMNATFGGASASRDSKTAYIAQQTVFLDFDIIELTFNRDGEYIVIPVVSSPSDAIGGIMAPIEEMPWWQVLIGLILGIILLIILLPLIPYILKLIIWLISIPIKLIAYIFKLIFRKRKKGGIPDE